MRRHFRGLIIILLLALAVTGEERDPLHDDFWWFHDCPTYELDQGAEGKDAEATSIVASCKDNAGTLITTKLDLTPCFKFLLKHENRNDPVRIESCLLREPSALGNKEVGCFVFKDGSTNDSDWKTLLYWDNYKKSPLKVKDGVLTCMDD
ncbi:hypothetical protein BDV28DRAFT_149564 [Aspergillus coremiiformis]|uniref:Cyanovirin-N domain-containing protein n=1 Tax=Aspergillus coremiiformis TaxID=138285 RepID=A0A5N6Z2H0_9EURO|nr:hypothetical protein BDV28DRAFT_149564 [Aspergillus coremiiformis]